MHPRKFRVEMVKRETFFIFKFWFVFVLLFQREAICLFSYLVLFIFVIWKATADEPTEAMSELLVFLKKGGQALKLLSQQSIFLVVEKDVVFEDALRPRISLRIYWDRAWKTLKGKTEALV